MSGISIISKKIQKPFCHVKLHRAIARISKVSLEEINQLIKTNETEREKRNDVPTAVPPTSIIPNRTDHLRMWVLSHNITRRSVNELLKILNSIGLKWLPMDSRTLCKTPRFTNVVAMDNGQYWYNGIGTNIRILFADVKSNLTLKLNVNVDGIPLMKSSTTQFWPILANIHSELRKKSYHICMCTQTNSFGSDFPDIEPFAIAIWCGQQKPKNLNAYLGPFVTELINLIRNGMEINGFHININLRCIVCDTPARCFVKGKIFIGRIICTLILY